MEVTARQKVFALILDYSRDLVRVKEDVLLHNLLLHKHPHPLSVQLGDCAQTAV
jgi:hypothetical protein